MVGSNYNLMVSTSGGGGGDRSRGDLDRILDLLERIEDLAFSLPLEQLPGLVERLERAVEILEEQSRNGEL